MNAHPSEDMLAAFVEGDLGEHVAIQIAEHIDACPLCAARVVALEPLAGAFARMPDPEVPEDLVASILAAAEAPDELEAPSSTPEIAAGLGFLLAAAGLAATSGEVLSWLSRAAVLAEATHSAARALQVALPSSLAVLFVGMAVAAVAVAMAATPFRVSTGRHP